MAEERDDDRSEPDVVLRLMAIGKLGRLWVMLSKMVILAKNRLIKNLLLGIYIVGRHIYSFLHLVGIPYA